MEQLKYRPDNSLKTHQEGQARIYTRTSQLARIRLSREYLKLALGLCERPKKICEVGCGTMDISGPFAEKYDVIGIDCNLKCVPIIQQRHPKASFEAHDLSVFAGVDCDVLVACEVLEHVLQPIELMKRLMPKAKTVVISHPLNEVDNRKNNEHYWRYSRQDFKAWFSDNNFELVKAKAFQNGCYYSIVGVGRNLD
jgi:2-polyprenyl-3-methyl-5-hydroxy-6-metoxy-1,4-benzoquinol methylase